jgi:putative hydrolase of the HAD superfamily
VARQTILIDADDTLWENNVFFQRTIEGFIARIEPLGYTRDYIRHILNQTEGHNIRQHGYGIHSFRRSLHDTYARLAGSLVQQGLVEEITELAAELEREPPKIFEGVPETLSYLASRHRLILVTKGHVAEQAAKVERSGLQAHFDAIEIVAEKDRETYERIIGQFYVVKSHGWMIGNSPRSDINPALKAGLNAVFVPHPRTWEMEHVAIETGAGRLLIVQRFQDLRSHF